MTVTPLAKRQRTSGLKTILLGGKVEVSQCCLGTMTWGVQNTEKEAHEQLDYFVKQGGNFVDTAEMYPVPPDGSVIGRTEQYIGTWLAADPARRAKIFLASKVAGPRPGGWIRGNRKPEYAEKAKDDLFNPALNREQIHEACESSLKRLQTDVIDLYQIHWPERNSPLFGKSIFDIPPKAHQLVPHKEETASFEEQVSAMGELIKLGKVRHWGLSNETSYGVMMFCHTADRLGVPRPISIQNDFSLVDRRFETELAETCYYMDLSLLAYGPLAGGALSGKYTLSSAAKTSEGLQSRGKDDSRHTLYPKFQTRYLGKATAVATEAYCELALSKNLSPTTLALAWCTTRTYIRDTGSVIIGATTMEQLKENMDALEVKLDQDTMRKIDKIHRANPNPNCDQPLSG
eukprot:TRINITY_DN13940_c0_g1_i1.p1 TRINITY_DN13940_c0_g1~~TRINITY_DN13940_c0_g1_i1.p1  ORF type:complete len:421 (-),score=62.42 TRINITY_DN13940_c0_g1_i1:111-1319(-)